MSDMTKRAVWLLALAVLFVGHVQLTSAASTWDASCDWSCQGNARVYECEFYDTSGHSACDWQDCYFGQNCCEADVEYPYQPGRDICESLASGTTGHGGFFYQLTSCSSSDEHQWTSCGNGYYPRVYYATMYCSFEDLVACP